ncbi:hypothetical protein RF11_11267 [Thelohanellus kitauei]|uniref:MULE transposase domain-containing protein n=1 Tax=Thelohanellus kitauei TaxID=669202 RepID=A0A0C2IWD8_THEKT|nr:hypothetical protein RF11_11267 [Thelohanellus kitauei]
MERKNHATYLKVWETLSTQMNLNITNSMSDFELAAFNAFRTFYPGSSHTCCFFHLSQSIWRKVQGLGLESDYTNNDEIRTAIKSPAALAFCPEEEVISSFELLEDRLNLSNFIQRVQSLYHYFEDAYIGRFNRRNRSIPPFPIPIWNQYNRVIENQPRTNNSVEGWHRAFSSIFNGPHLNSYNFIKKLIEEEALTHYRLNRIEVGDELKPSLNPKYIRINQRIHQFVLSYNQHERLQYLNVLSDTFTF